MENYHPPQNMTYFSQNAPERTPNLIHVNAYHQNFQSKTNEAWTSRSDPTYTVPFIIDYHRLTLAHEIPTKTYINPLVIPSKTVLVNPHFKRNVHVNPHFEAKPQEPNKVPAIHVNPKLKELNKVPAIHVNPILKDLNKIPAIHVNPKALDKIQSKLEKASVQTEKVAYVPPEIPKTQRNKRRISFRSKYKIVRSGERSNTSKTTIVKSTYKIDRRDLKVVNMKRKIARNKFIHTIPITRRKVLKSPFNARKKYSYVVTKGLVCEPMSSVKYRNVSVSKNMKTIRGYSITRQGKTLKKVNVKINESVIQKKKEKRFSFENRYGIPTSRSTIKVRVRPRKSTRKDNTQCPFYRKFGICKGFKNGSCTKVHDPNRISVCKKFLKGACNSENCKLSHDVSLKKMPTCKFFLEGFCGKNDCPYLHVKLNPKAEICKDFLQGYCNAADECNKRHVSICPAIDRDGVCNNRRCQYPHKLPKINDTSVKKIDVKLKKRVGNVADKNIEQTETVTCTKTRYHVTMNENDMDEKPREDKIVKTKLPDILPDFIPFDH